MIIINMNTKKIEHIRLSAKEIRKKIINAILTQTNTKYKQTDTLFFFH